MLKEEDDATKPSNINRLDTLMMSGFSVFVFIKFSVSVCICARTNMYLCVSE
eukprot:m.332523 g.332523  ORF g.332523 m.332523 type:complete len:52 (-) comp16956_c0_seq1:72-227(-)